MFSIQVIQNLLRNGYENETKDGDMLEQQFQHDDYWMKILCTVQVYDLNKRTKFINKDIFIRRLFPPLPRYGEQLIDTRTQSKITNHDFSSSKVI